VPTVLEADGAVTGLQSVPERVRVDPKIRGYIVDVARATREDTRARVGISPRGIQRLFEAARARAVLSGRSYVAPDDVKRVVEPAFVHRIVLTTEARVADVEPATVVEDALDSVDVPAVTGER
jgi:MoxR-like ATPase